ncbi:ATP-binding protein [Candidatus Contubernalis alkalaceticus]|uniref:ATP-binding protein n=1 Tax=Candidatus Contubernalis alkaliaceticus TaxID=338645 RepID=UPI00387E3610
MIKRDIIKINEDLCDGCGICVPSCAEGAIKIIDGKAKLVSEIYCDGLGACLGDCPQGAISIEEREAQPFDEAAVEEYLKSLAPEEKEEKEISCLSESACACHLEGKEVSEIPQEESQGNCACHQAGENQANAEMLQAAFSPENSSHHEAGASHDHEDDGGCPACAALSGEIHRENKGKEVMETVGEGPTIESELTHWPVKLKLVSPEASFLKKPHLLVAADCVPFTYADFHRRFLRDKPLVIGCPKLDDASYYMKKLVQIFKNYDYKKVTVVNIGIPCCSGLQGLVEKALLEAGSKAELDNVVIGIEGNIK